VSLLPNVWGSAGDRRFATAAIALSIASTITGRSAGGPVVTCMEYLRTFDHDPWSVGRNGRARAETARNVAGADDPADGQGIVMRPKALPSQGRRGSRRRGP
jgi:hypothetical protein